MAKRNGAPQRIYLQFGPDCTPDDITDSEWESGEVTWCADRVYETDIEYVNAATIARLTAENERLTRERDEAREVIGDDGATRVVAYLRSDNAGLRCENHLLKKSAKHGVGGAPEGYEPIEAWTDGKQIVVLGSPPDEDNNDDPSHNCDAMGCSSMGPHVLAYFDHPLAALSARPSSQEGGG